MSKRPITIAPSPTGRGYRLSTQQTLKQPVNEVFDFFADAFQLETITPPWLNFRVITPRPIEIKAGALIDYRLRLHGVPIRWRTEIEVWEPPHRFVDRQVRGPYRWWRHEHRFLETNGETVMDDEVEYAAPLGWLAQSLVVRRDLERIFSYRQDRIAEIFAKSST